MRPGRTWREFARDFGAIAGVVLVYFFLRGAIPDRPGQAVDLSLDLIRFEKAVGIFHEQDLQDFSIRSAAVKEAANMIYAFLHFPALIAAAAILWWRNPAKFRLARNTFYASMVLGLACYYASPAAPPRVLAEYGHDFGFVDTVFGNNQGAETFPELAIFRNDFAAIPSFHFGWMLFASAALWVAGGGVPSRAAAIILLVVMTWASAATGNHFFIDMILGGAAMVTAFFAALGFERAGLDARIAGYTRRVRGRENRASG
jgi:hypothetical protein